VSEYLCMDGPLSGQQLDWDEGTTPGQTLTVAVVDVGQPEVAPDEEPEADYRIERLADDDLPGRLRFVGGRGPWRPSDAPASLLEV